MYLMGICGAIILLFQRVIPKERVEVSIYVCDGLMIFTRPQSGNDFETGASGSQAMWIATIRV